MRASAPLVLVMILIACASDTPIAPGGPVNARVVLTPGETADIRGAGIRLRFVGVIADSRCPADAICIQLGEAIVRIDVLPAAGERATYDLHSGNMQPVRHGDLTIALIEIAPYPYSNRPIGPGDYRATLGISR
jgi:hypothetical protein